MHKKKYQFALNFQDTITGLLDIIFPSSNDYHIWIRTFGWQVDTSACFFTNFPYVGSTFSNDILVELFVNGNL